MKFAEIRYRRTKFSILTIHLIENMELFDC